MWWDEKVAAKGKTAKEDEMKGSERNDKKGKWEKGRDVRNITHCIHTNREWKKRERWHKKRRRITFRTFRILPLGIKLSLIFLFFSFWFLFCPLMCLQMCDFSVFPFFLSLSFSFTFARHVFVIFLCPLPLWFIPPHTGRERFLLCVMIISWERNPPFKLTFLPFKVHQCVFWQMTWNEVLSFFIPFLLSLLFVTREEGEEDAVFVSVSAISSFPINCYEKVLVFLAWIEMEGLDVSSSSLSLRKTVTSSQMMMTVTME